MPGDGELLLGTPRNFLRPCILLLLAERPSHGYDLLERLRDLGYSRADPGMLYRSLRAMEQEGLVGSDWEASDVGPPRRTYRLSADGEEWLHAWAGGVRQTKRLIGAFLDRYEAFSHDPVQPQQAP